MTAPPSPSSPRLRTPARRWDWAMARTLRDLDNSRRRRRVISLPNLLRLYRRRIGPAIATTDQAAKDRERRHLTLLREQYKT